MNVGRLPGAAPGWIVLAAGLIAVGVSALSAPVTPRGPSEATYRLQAESLARDGDRSYDESDRERFASKDWPALEARVVISSERDTLRFHRPLPYSLALAPFVWIAPQRGPLVLNWLLLSALSVGLALRWSRDSPRSAPYWTVALFFGTVVFAYSRAVWAELFAGSLLVLAYVLTRDEPPRRELPQMAAERVSGARLALRWLGVGVLLGMATLQEPLYAVCLVAVLIPSLRARNEVAWLTATSAFSAVLIAAWLAGGGLFPGVTPWAADSGLPIRSGDALADVSEWAGRLRSVEAPALVWDPLLAFWNGIYAFLGRHSGLVPSFLPLALLVASARRVRWPLWWAAGAVLAAAILLDPFDFAGGPEALGLRRMVPLVLLCCFTSRVSTSVWPAVAAAVLGVLAVWPLWVGLRSHPEELRAGSFWKPLASVLPYETSQHSIPAGAEVFSRLLFVRTANDGLLAGSSGAHFVLRGGRQGELMVAAASRLAHVDFEFGASAETQLEVEGGTVDKLLFRPEGGVTFRVAPDKARIRHRIRGRDDSHFLYMLRFSMPGGERQDQPFSVVGLAAETGSL